MPDYSKGKVYKIVCNITGDQYFGSTTQTLAQRLVQHRKQHLNKRKCKSSQIIERGDYQIVLCEECPCDNVEQLRAIERKWIEENECINKAIPNRTRKEYYQQPTEVVKRKNNYQKNKEVISIDGKEYYQKNKEQIKQKRREYYEKNKEKIADYKRQYYQQNKLSD